MTSSVELRMMQKVTLNLEKSTDNWNTSSSISSTIYNVGIPNNNNWNNNVPYRNSYTFPIQEPAIAGTSYRIKVLNYSPKVNVWFDSVQNGANYGRTSFQITQTNVAAIPPPVLTAPGSSSIYWTTGSSQDKVLTSSYFAPYWTAPDSLYTQNSISEVYGPNLPFIINPYTDVIRFEGDEGQVYTIVDANLDSTYTPVIGQPLTASLMVTLDRGITPGTNINSFLIRRFHPNPNYVVMNAPVISGSGYLIPQYITNDIRQNFDNIIVKLKESGLI
jgi:hypothetical protein